MNSLEMHNNNYNELKRDLTAQLLNKEKQQQEFQQNQKIFKPIFILSNKTNNFQINTNVKNNLQTPLGYKNEINLSCHFQTPTIKKNYKNEIQQEKTQRDTIIQSESQANTIIQDNKDYIKKHFSQGSVSNFKIPSSFNAPQVKEFQQEEKENKKKDNDYQEFLSCINNNLLFQKTTCKCDKDSKEIDCDNKLQNIFQKKKLLNPKFIAQNFQNFSQEQQSEMIIQHFKNNPTSFILQLSREQIERPMNFSPYIQTILDFLHEKNYWFVDKIDIKHLKDQNKLEYKLPKNGLANKNVQGDIVVEGLKLMTNISQDLQFIMYLNIAIASYQQLNHKIITWEMLQENLQKLKDIFQSEKFVQETTRLQNGQTNLPHEIELKIAENYYQEATIFSEDEIKTIMNKFLANSHAYALTKCKLFQKVYLNEANRNQNELNYSQFPFRSKCQLIPLFLLPGNDRCIMTNACMQFLFALNKNFRNGKKGINLNIRWQLLNVLKSIPYSQNLQPNGVHSMNEDQYCQENILNFY